MLTIDPQTLAACGVVGTAIGTGWAAYERKRNSKTVDALRVAAGKDELITVKDQIIAAKEEEHKEYLRYREEHHKKVEEMSGKILVLTEDNAMLKERSDLHPVMEALKMQNESQKQQSTITLQILDSLKSLTSSISLLTAQVREVLGRKDSQKET